MLACLKSYYKNYETHFFHLGKSPLYFAKCLTDHFIQVVNGESWQNKLEAYVKENASLEFTMIAVSYGLQNALRDLFRDCPNVHFAFISEENIEVGENKELQALKASEAGLNVLESDIIKKSSDSTSLTFPIVIRPLDEKNNHGLKAEIINDKYQLKEKSEKQALIAQPFISGPNVLLHIARESTGKTTYAGYLVEHKFEGVALTIRQASLPEALIKSAEKLLEDMQFVGVCHFDFISDSENYYFLDLNLRLGGTTNKVFASGYDEPSLLINAFDQQIRPRSRKLKKLKITNYLGLTKAILTSIKHPSNNLDYPVKSRTKKVLGLIGLMLTSIDEILMGPRLHMSLIYYLHVVSSKLKKY